MWFQLAKVWLTKSKLLILRTEIADPLRWSNRLRVRQTTWVRGGAGQDGRPPTASS
jgi:hypothetical protein